MRVSAILLTLNPKNRSAFNVSLQLRYFTLSKCPDEWPTKGYMVTS